MCIRDRAGTTFVSCSWQSLPATATEAAPCSETGGTVTASLDGWLDAGSNAILEIEVTVDSGTEGTTLTNDATATYEDGIGRTYAPVTATDDTVVGNANICWAVADSGDTLVTIDRPTGVVNVIGNTGTVNIEALAIDPFTRNVYATDAGRFGKLDTTTGAFTEISAAIGTGSDGAGGTRAFNDVDGLAFDLVLRRALGDGP